MANRIRILTNQYYFYNSSPTADIDNLRCSEFEWNKPPIGFIKLNCDATWDEDAKAGGLDTIARDSDGLIMGIRALTMYHCHSSWECKGLALLEALRMGEQLKANKIIIESDCYKVVHSLNVKADEEVGLSMWYKDSFF
ncbi:hypothetical protein QQ045_004507 [Rhodiola kirilowii]